MADTVIKRVGGKVKLREWIKDKFPVHSTYVEPFGGSFAVGFSMPYPSGDYRVVFNDLDHHLFNFFRVLRDHKETFLEKLELTPYSREDYELCHKSISHNALEGIDEIEWARRYLVYNRQSFAGKEDGTWSISRHGENIALTWAKLPRLAQDVAENLRGCFLECSDYRDVFRRWDSPQTLFYVDPPYENVESDYYKANKQDGFDHGQLAQEIAKLQGSVAVSYYDSEYIRSLYPTLEVHTVEVIKHMQTSGKGKKAKDKGTELLLVKHSDWSKQKESIFDA